MRVKTFEAVDMRRALSLVKEELGPNAVIVSSRSVRRDGALFGLLGRTVLEVTAAVEDETRTDPPRLKGSVSGHAAIERSKPATRTSQSYRDLWAVKQAVDPLMDEVRAIRESLAGLESPSTARSDDLRSDLAQIRSLLASVVSVTGLGGDASGAAAQRLFHFLLARGIDEPLVRSLVQRVVSAVEPGALGDLDRLKQRLATEMRGDLARAQRGAPPGRVQIFVGPSGVGKTTTIAKLAARAVRTAPGSVLVVTTDVHRVAAVEQMVRYGEILGVPVESALNPGDLARVIERAGDRERIFVDTPGHSHRDPATHRELEALAQAAGEAELMLVTSATTRASDSREILDSYSVLPWSRLIVTKLDETRVHGELYNAVVRSGRPIAAVTTGHAVPEHLEALDVTGILRKVLRG
ncbi:MAG: flagellar biosynthesis protein FlhF [Myxococcota bacterium]